MTAALLQRTPLIERRQTDSVTPIVGEPSGADRAELRRAAEGRAETVRDADDAARSARSPLDEALIALCNAKEGDNAALEAARERVGIALTGDRAPRRLAAWLRANARGWMQKRPARFAIVLDAAVVLRAPGVEPLLVEALNTATDETLLRVAAQRARHIVYVSDALRLGAWESFQNRLALLQDDPRVVPSAAWLGRTQAIPWLLKRLDDPEPRLAGAAAMGLLDLAAQGADAARLADDKREEIASRALARLERRDDAASSILWLLGSVGTVGNVDAVAKALVKAFVAGGHLEPAAAARAASNLVREPFPKAALAALTAAIREIDGAQENRFLQLVLRKRGP